MTDWRIILSAVASAKKELKEIMREAERQGWRVDKTKRGHPQFFAPDGENLITGSETPSDHRSIDNLVARRGATV